MLIDKLMKTSLTVGTVLVSTFFLGEAAEALHQGQIIDALINGGVGSTIFLTYVVYLNNLQLKD